MADLVTRRVRRRRIVVLLCLTMMIASAGSIWRPSAQSPSGDPPDQAGAISPTGPRADRDPSDRGATYEWLEGRATRVTIKFPEVTAMAERGSDGDLKTRLMDAAGNELATFGVDRRDAVNTMLVFQSPGAADVRVSGGVNVRATLDWASRQAYSLWKDRAARGSQLEWQGGLLRSRGAPARDLDRDVAEVRTDWSDGFSATAVKGSGARRNAFAGKPTRVPSFVSRLRKDNADVGVSRWFAEEQVLEWSFPGLSEGYLDGGRLEKIGGWPFTPDMAWGNVQSFAFHYFHTLVATQGFVAERQKSWKDAIAGAVMPTVFANEPGCDGLHWLDGTLFRPCCDSHDRCYQRYGCTSSSWWVWWRSWTCDRCNMSAAFCFASGGKSPYYQSP